MYLLSVPITKDQFKRRPKNTLLTSWLCLRRHSYFKMIRWSCGMTSHAVACRKPTGYVFSIRVKVLRQVRLPRSSILLTIRKLKYVSKINALNFETFEYFRTLRLRKPSRSCLKGFDKKNLEIEKKIFEILDVKLIPRELK